MRTTEPITISEQLTKGKFHNQKHRLRVNLLYSSYWLNDRMAEFLKPYDLTMQQFNILRILRGIHPEPISTKQMRQRMIINNSDTSRLLDRLIDKDLAWKRPCPHDARQIQAFISDKGQQLLSEIDGHMEELDNTMENLTEKEARYLNELLIKMRFGKD